MDLWSLDCVVFAILCKTRASSCNHAYKVSQWLNFFLSNIICGTTLRNSEPCLSFSFKEITQEIHNEMELISDFKMNLERR